MGDVAGQQYCACSPCTQCLEPAQHMQMLLLLLLWEALLYRYLCAALDCVVYRHSSCREGVCWMW